MPAPGLDDKSQPFQRQPQTLRDASSAVDLAENERTIELPSSGWRASRQSLRSQIASTAQGDRLFARALADESALRE